MLVGEANHHPEPEGSVGHFIEYGWASGQGAHFDYFYDGRRISHVARLTEVRA